MLERSIGIQNSIDRVRDLPQDHWWEKREKRKQARRLRMQILIDNAKAAWEVTSQLENNPLTTAGELIAQVESTNQITFPRTLSGYIENLIGTKNRLAMELIKLQVKYKNEEIGGIMYRLISEGKLPKGKITLKYHPFAIKLICDNEEDYKAVKPGESDGCLFPADTPIILLYGKIDNCSRTEKHEESHLKTLMIRRTLPAVSKQVVWGRYAISRNIEKDFEIIIGKIKLGINEENVVDSEEGQRILGHFFGCVKDEILAYYSSEKFLLLPSDYFVAGLLEGYDYFSKFGVKNGELKKLDQIYCQKVFRGAKTGKQVFQLFERYNHPELAFWVLAQIPFEKWNEDLIEPLKQAIKTKL